LTHDPSPASEVRELLARFNLRVRKSLGQNFLIDTAALDRITAAAALTPADTVLEIGPGLGTLTRRLAQAAGRVVAVEIDQNLIPPLRVALAAHPNVELIHGDILQLDPATLLTPHPTTRPPTLHPRQLQATPDRTGRGRVAGAEGRLSDYPTPNLAGRGQAIRLPNYKVVANLPYYITSAVIRHLLEASIQPSLLILTMQLEVAQRLIAGPGDLSLLAISVQFYGKPSLVTHIKAGSFYPAPQVDSAVVRIDVHPQPPVDVHDVDRFFAVVKSGFSQKRKQIHNSLRSGLALPAPAIDAALAQANVDPKRRAETLTLQEWATLSESLRPETRK
jgi:16S rRNA (adenine1518-N6/adenine1519-N6)-dimethyltransferase